MVSELELFESQDLTPLDFSLLGRMNNPVCFVSLPQYGVITSIYTGLTEFFL